MKLISMTDFVLERQMSSICCFADEMDYLNYQTNAFEKATAYANFLKQPLKLGLFIPCDKDGCQLEVPKILESEDFYSVKIEMAHNKKVEIYQQAKGKVLFEGDWTLKEDDIFGEKLINLVDFDKIGEEIPQYYVENDFTIEDLIDYTLTLTPSAIKQLGL